MPAALAALVASLGSAWLWIIGGLVLAGAEILLPGIFLIWLGLAALLTGLGAALLPMPWQAQVLVWAVLSLASVALDLSGRPAFVYNVKFPSKKIGTFDVELVHESLRSLANAAKINLHVNVPYGDNSHHIAEAIFKALAKSLRQAVALDPRNSDVPSTKGTL